MTKKTVPKGALENKVGIGLLPLCPGNQPVGFRSAGNGVRPKPKTKHNGCQDRVQISDRAKEIQRIKVLADQPEAKREERIKRIGRLVEVGTYRVSGKKLADALTRQTIIDEVL